MSNIVLIDELHEVFDLSDDVKSYTVELVNKVSKEPGYRQKFTACGGNRSMSAVLTYVSARQNNVPLSPNTVVDYMTENYNPSQYFTVTKLRSIHRDMLRDFDLQYTECTPEDFIDYYDLGLEAKTVEAAKKLAGDYVDQTPKKGTSRGLTAAAAIYVASSLRGEDIMQTQICDAFDVSTTAVRYRYKDILEEVGGIDAGKSKLSDLNLTLKSIGVIV